MPHTIRLRDVFGDFFGRWPRDVISKLPSPDATETGWLTALDQAVELHNVRTEVVRGDVSVAAEASFRPARPATPTADGFSFRIASCSDIEFYVQEVTEPTIQLLVSFREGWVEVVVEGLPVEMRLPRDLVTLHPDHASERQRRSGQFVAGQLDSQEITFHQRSATVVRTHLRIHKRAGGEIAVRTPTPISFGRCSFLGLPCTAAYDFQLMPSPQIARQTHEWLRHNVHDPMRGGAFAIRSLDIDFKADPFNRSRLSFIDERAHWVFEDLVFAFLSPSFFFLPHHATIGVRRNLEATEDPGEILKFERAPVQLTYGSGDSRWAIILNKFFWVSPQIDDVGDLFAGLEFDGAIIFGRPEDDNDVAVTFALEENATVRLGMAREPTHDAPGEDTTSFFHFDLIDQAVIDLIGVKVGFSFGDLAAGQPPENCWELLLDLWVRGDEAARQGDSAGEDDGERQQSTGRRSGGGPLKIETSDGKPFSLVIRNLGFSRGQITLDTFELPDGATVMLGPVGLALYEIGVVAESGASYFSMSGGLLIKDAQSFEFESYFRRLRFKIAGAPQAPDFLLDGLGLKLSIPDLLKFEIFGYYTKKILEFVRKEEGGLSGSLELKLSGASYLFLLDLIVGKIIPLPEAPPGTSRFTYLMIQIVVEAQINLAMVECRGIRVLLAANMLPVLSEPDLESGELRYYKWARDNDPMTVPGDRRLAAWRPVDKSVAFGVGLTISFSGMGEVFRLRAFVMFVDSPDEGALLIALELFLMKAQKPSGWGVLELDTKNDKFFLLAGVDIELSQFIENAPEFVDELFRITGTVLIANKPATFALGRLNDQATWLTLQFNVSLFEIFRAELLLALCFEFVEGGPKGFGTVFRIEASADSGLWSLTVYAGVHLILGTLTSGSGDFTFILAAEMGITISLLRFLQFGLSIAGDIEHVAHDPKYTVFSLLLRIETPWFLPDVTFSIEHVDGDIGIADRGVAVGPLLSADATIEATGGSVALHAARIDGLPGGSQPRLMSVNELAAATLDEAPRRQAFLSSGGAPVATDATIGLNFSAIVEDALGIGGTSPELATQAAGDDSAEITLHYRLEDLRVRRRPRFADAAPWAPIEERTIVTAEDGRTATFGRTDLSMFWSPEVRGDGRTAAKILLINGSTPFRFETEHTAVDEELVREQPAWPCCAPAAPAVHTLSFRRERRGPLGRRARRFEGTHSYAHVVRPGFVKPALLPGAVEDTDTAVHVAAFDVLGAGTVLYVTFDDDVAAAMISVSGVAPFAFTVEVILRDGRDEIVHRESVLVEPLLAWRKLPFVAPRPVRMLELRTSALSVQRIPLSQFSILRLDDLTAGVLEVDEISYVTSDELARVEAEQRRCQDPAALQRAFAGRGKVFFLPHHDYEIEIDTQVRVRHTSTEWHTASTREFVYFSTKGHPGLNATPAVGQEVDPYVASRYPHERAWLYRTEPVAVAFTEDFSVVVPLASRDFGGGLSERAQILELDLAVTPDVPPDDTSRIGTATADDWITSHRRLEIRIDATLASPRPWNNTSRALTAAARSTDRRRERLAALTQRAESTCRLPDPRVVDRGVLLAMPPPGADGTPALWAADRAYVASVRPRGSPFINRRRFEAADATAFSIRDLVGQAGSALTHDGDAIVFDSPTPQLALVGEDYWDHVELRSRLTPGAGRAAIGVALHPETMHGLFTVIEPGVDGPLLRVREGLDGAVLAETRISGEETLLEITLFDDALRVKAGEATIEVPREGVGPGRLALAGHGGARFSSLFVSGLTVWQFAFRTSRFETFADHIRSWDGDVPLIEPDVMGAGSRRRSLSDLLAATRAAIDRAALPEADGAVREALFAQWVSELALPLRELVPGLRLSALAVGSRAEALLLESPEPIDVICDCRVALLQRPTAPPVDVRVRDDVESPGRVPAPQTVTLTTGKIMLPWLTRIPIPRQPTAPLPPQTHPAQPPSPAPRPTSAPLKSTSIPAIPVKPGVRSPATTQVVASPIRIDQPVADKWVPVDRLIIQNGAATKALILPVRGGMSSQLPSGTYRLAFTLNRRRWESTDTEPLAEYSASHELTIQF
jgi:hypothetical protein